MGWETRQVEIANRQAEREIRLSQQQALAAAQGKSSLNWETASQSSQASTAAPATPRDMEEVERLAAADKEVRKLEKALCEISKLEGRRDLDNMQRAKLACKSDVEADLDSAWGLARARARNELRRASQD